MNVFWIVSKLLIAFILYHLYNYLVCMITSCTLVDAQTYCITLTSNLIMSVIN